MNLVWPYSTQNSRHIDNRPFTASTKHDVNGGVLKLVYKSLETIFVRMEVTILTWVGEKLLA